MRNKVLDKLFEIISIVLCVPITLSIFAGLICLGIDLLRWLKTDVWQPIMIPASIHLETGWLGLDRLLQWLFALPAAAWLILIFPMLWGLIIIYPGDWLYQIFKWADDAISKKA
jgi:hypothetical protein